MNKSKQQAKASTLKAAFDTKSSLSENFALSENIAINRAQRITKIRQHDCWDMIIIGGGITGAGILKLASQIGLKVLLVEQKDFAWGSSSRSSKMVHGGLRYMAQGQIGLTRESVIERQRLLKEGQPLIAKQSFVMSHYKKAFPGPWVFNQLLACYDFIAGIKQHKFWPKSSYLALAPKVKEEQLLGGTQFFDALTDDARLVQRLIQESLQLGGQALNYAKVTKLESQKQNQQITIEIDGCESALTINAKVVINACGAWSELLKANCVDVENKNKKPVMHMRPLRGSHIIIPNWRLPVASVIAIRHAHDKRPVQVYPWQNVTVVGTTDVEHKQNMAKDAQISQSEFDYLLAAIEQQFPDAKITEQDVISTFAGVRPVMTSEPSAAPSKEKREHYIEQNAGVISVTGGKLTTFRLIAEQVLQMVGQYLVANSGYKKLNNNYQAALELACKQPILSPSNSIRAPFFNDDIKQQINANYGEFNQLFVILMEKRYCNPIRYSKYLWAELIWSVQFEQVFHLDDLLLRRTRIGNVLPNGAQELIPKIKQLCAPFLPWNEEQWQREINRYCAIWQRAYSVPNNQQRLGKTTDKMLQENNN